MTKKKDPAPPAPKGKATDKPVPKARPAVRPTADHDDSKTIVDAPAEKTRTPRTKKAAPAPAATPEFKTVKPGDILNDIFEVRRLIGRGGMGEVFEGINISSEEPVAIKVILPHLAKEPKVLAMFRREALLLTRLSHPAIVQYRVLAHEPRLGVFYIATDFIGGDSLARAVDYLECSPADLLALTRRLAEGLDAAHRLGVIHRDISPDNVMLPDGKIDDARIIDFGIAKDLGPGSATIVGEGFAGKLNYVAPEQLGEFDREVGPWSDVYSLALTILAVARRASLDLGGSLVDAVDKRRKGIDVSAAPAELRPVLQKMLAHNPQDRFHSMAEVIAALDRLGPVSGKPIKPAIQIAGAAEREREGLPKKELTSVDAPGGGPRTARAWKTIFDRTLLRFGITTKSLAIIAGAVFLAMVGLYWINHNGGAGEAVSPDETPSTPQPVVLSPEEQVYRARQSIARLLPSLGCTWLNLAGANYDNGKIAVSVEGISGTAEAAILAKGKIEQALRTAGLVPGPIYFDGVGTVDITDCRPIDTFKKFGILGGSHRITGKTTWEIQKLGRDAGEYQGMQAAMVQAEADLSKAGGSARVLFLEKDQLILVGDPSVYTSIGKSRYRLDGVTAERGWSAIILLIGKGPFDQYVLNGKLATKPDWSERFAEVATARGWTVEMHWFQVVDKVPN